MLPPNRVIRAASQSSPTSTLIGRLTEPHDSISDLNTRRVLQMLATWHLIALPLGPILALSQVFAGEADRVSAVWLVLAPLLALVNYLLSRSRWGQVTLWFQVAAIYGLIVCTMIIRPESPGPIFGLILPAMTAALCLRVSGYVFVQIVVVLTFIVRLLVADPGDLGRFIGMVGVLGTGSVLLATLVVHQQWLRRMQIRQLGEETDRARALLEVVFDGTATLDNDRIVAVTEGFCEVVGADAQLLIGRRVDEALPFKLQHAGTLAEAVPFLDSDGALRYVACVRQAIGQSDERREVMALRDQTHEQLHKANLHYAGRMAAVGTLAAGVAHEVNNALMSLMGQTELSQIALDRGQFDRFSQSLERISLASERIAVCVTRLRKFSSDAGNTPQVVDINDIVDSTVGLAKYTIRHVADLSVELGEQLPSVLAVEAWVSQIVMNLLLNAVEAVRHRGAGSVVVSTRIDGDDVVIGVEDNGEGVPEEDADRIFQPFFTTKGEDGSGLGLSISASLVARMAGSLSLQSSEIGARFEIRIPRADKQNQ
ncbi:MAG TPA: hypothetical protein DCQ06_09125 [Myxococcales bacterium]|nr:hypothetical protein [Myxococcales bacterium]HAN31743.1 hypothetical protein [Myxococcales bacterium]